MSLITLILGITFVESVATAVISAMGLVFDIPTVQGTRHLDQEGQQKEVDKLHDFLVNGNNIIVFTHNVSIVCPVF